MASIRKSFYHAKKCNDLIYFVEDDYLHDINTVNEIILTYERISSQIKRELILCPADYPFLYTKIEKTNIKLSTAFAECEVLGEMARGEMVTDVLSEVDDYWKNRNIVVDKCMISKGFKLK